MASGDNLAGLIGVGVLFNCLRQSLKCSKSP
jgi:hypothetical protein